MLEQYLRGSVENWRSLDDVAAAMDACIQALAKEDETVNTKL